MSGESGGPGRFAREFARVRQARLALPTAVAYIVVFAVVDVALESSLETPHQIAIRIVLVALAALFAAAIMVRDALDGLAERARVQVAEQRLEAVLLTLRQLYERPPVRGTSAVESQATDGALSPREREVAALIARGHSSREIAEMLVISEKTADTHADRIRAKLGLHSRAEIAAWATGWGIAFAPDTQLQPSDD